MVVLRSGYEIVWYNKHLNPAPKPIHDSFPIFFVDHTLPAQAYDSSTLPQKTAIYAASGEGEQEGLHRLPLFFSFEP